MKAVVRLQFATLTILLFISYMCIKFLSSYTGNKMFKVVMNISASCFNLPNIKRSGKHDMDSCEKSLPLSYSAPSLDICILFCRCTFGYEGKRCEKKTSVNLQPTKVPNPGALPKNRNLKELAKAEDLGNARKSGH